MTTKDEIRTAQDITEILIRNIAVNALRIASDCNDVKAFERALATHLRECANVISKPTLGFISKA